MTLRTLAAVVLACSAVALPRHAGAQAPAPAAASPAAPAGDVVPLQATVTGVEGLVQVRDNEAAAWRKAEVGMVLPESAEFRTGPRSAVRFTIPPAQTVTLDRLGTVKLVQAVNDSGVIRTNIGMKYGRTRYDVEAAGVEHESSISSPSSTLAVRGTKVSLYDQRPFRPEAVSLTGRAEFRDLRRKVAFGAAGQGKTTVNADADSAAAAALDESISDPGASLARTEGEDALFNTLIAGGATVTFDRGTGLRVITGGTPPRTDGELIPQLPGTLNFVLRWQTNANLDLGVGAPGGVDGGGEFLYPAVGLTRSVSGGRVAWDHRGGANGGIEVIYWPRDYAAGIYGLGIVLVSGEPTNATVDAFRDGRRLPIFDGSGFVETNTVFVLPPTPGIAEGTLGGLVPVDANLPGFGGGSLPAGLKQRTIGPVQPPATPAAKPAARKGR